MAVGIPTGIRAWAGCRMGRPGRVVVVRRPFDVAARLRALVADPASGARFSMRIDAAGDWYHQGGRIPRPALVGLFATALHRALDGSYWLVTPVEAGEVVVEDVPFTIVELGVDEPGAGQTVQLRTNLDEWVPLDALHELTMRAMPGTTTLVPYVVVRPAAPGRLALEARLLRPVFYHLVELGQPDASGAGMAVRSAGRDFDLGRLEAA